MDVLRFVDYHNKVVENCSKVIVGKDDVISLVLTSFVCGGHVLLEDIPGTGKTMLLRAFAKTIGGDFKRIQFTPDLLPSDLTGINFYNQKTGEFFSIVNSVGIALIGQTGNLAPADKKLYALRDVTATVDSLPLIASSIMSKKLASGADAIVLDVKAGSGAFMKTTEAAYALAKEMVAIGHHAGRNTVALITNMDRPLGCSIGNSLEVIEAIETLKGKGPDDFNDLCIELAANMLFLAEKGSLDDCRKLAVQRIADGSALQKFRDMIAAQGGDPAVVDDYSIFPQASIQREICAEESGYVSHMDTQNCGISAMLLGAGRATKEDSIDHAAGIILNIKPGDFVEKGQTLAILYTNDPVTLDNAEQQLRASIHLSSVKPQVQPLIYGRVEFE